MQQPHGQQRQQQPRRRHDAQRQPRIDVGLPEEGIAEAVHHVEERIGVRGHLPERRQRMHRIEHARQEGERHHQEVLERRDLIELLGPDGRHQPQRAQNAAGSQRKDQHPQRMPHRHIHEAARHQQHAGAHHEAAHHGRQHVAAIHRQRRERCQQHEHQIAAHLALDERGRGIAKGVLHQRHHHQPRHQEAGVGHARIDGHMAAECMRKDQQIQQRRQHWRSNGLQTHLAEAHQLLAKERQEALHQFSCISRRNTSSRSGWVTSMS